MQGFQNFTIGKAFVAVTFPLFLAVMLLVVVPFAAVANGCREMLNRN